MVNFYKSLGKSGDTIVEVLIAIMVVSSVLTGAFAISNMSLKSIRMSQERSEAQKIAQQSVESLNGALRTNTNPSLLINEFCIVQISDVDTIIAYTDDECLNAPDGRYRTKIVKFDANSTYKVTVSWDGLNGIKQEVIFYYRTSV